MRVYVDSDILIWHLRGEPKAARVEVGLCLGAALAPQLQQRLLKHDGDRDHLC
jgi:hypothetical protein